jgi:hypothetical protein
MRGGDGRGRGGRARRGGEGAIGFPTHDVFEAKLLGHFEVVEFMSQSLCAFDRRVLDETTEEGWETREVAGRVGELGKVDRGEVLE